jgi:hypothetical protein
MDLDSEALAQAVLQKMTDRKAVHLIAHMQWPPQRTAQEAGGRLDLGCIVDHLWKRKDSLGTSRVILEMCNTASSRSEVFDRTQSIALSLLAYGVKEALGSVFPVTPSGQGDTFFGAFGTALNPPNRASMASATLQTTKKLRDQAKGYRELPCFWAPFLCFCR